MFPYQPPYNVPMMSYAPLSKEESTYYKNLYNNLYEKAYDSLPPNAYVYGSVSPFGIQAYQPYQTGTWNSYSPLSGFGFGSTPYGAYGTAFPTAFSMSGNAATMTAQAAAAAAATNAALAGMPQAAGYFPGTTPAEVAAQQAMLAQMYGTGPSAWMNMFQKPPPTQLAPYKPAEGQQFWCKETDGSWTLRTKDDIVAGEVAPGYWERHATSGYFYWVRQ